LSSLPTDDLVFRALSDPSRRLLLDRLFERDGQTLGELCEHLPAMTRFGVMKHLRLLEQAGLVTSRKVGREKLHYLNPVPIGLIHDRWTGKYHAAWVDALGGLKVALESEGAPGRPRHVYAVYIRTTAERLWKAITSPEYTRRFFHSGRYETSWRPGDPYRTILPDGSTPFEGRILEYDPPRRLVYTFDFVADEETSRDRPSRVSWEITPYEGVCKLTLVHDDFDGETATFHYVERSGGWAYILSNLKSVLETGEALPPRLGSSSRPN